MDSWRSGSAGLTALRWPYFMNQIVEIAQVTAFRTHAKLLNCRSLALHCSPKDAKTRLMASLRYLFRSATVSEEREFERDNVARKTEKYLRTNPLDRVRDDPIYGLKIRHIRDGLQAEGKPIQGLILDIGGNTAGEATVLRQEGYRFVVGDINELALEISRKRVAKFGLVAPEYVALNALELPFPENSFSAVTIIEALHHMPDYDKALAEIYRVLKPGGVLYSHEPNGLNPLRRLSEWRDRMRGTIEKSFFVSQLQTLCKRAGFREISVRALAFGVSTWKAQEVPLYRRPVHYLHGYLQAKLPYFFGPLDIRARKPGRLKDQTPEGDDWKHLLRNPINGKPVTFHGSTGRWVDTSGEFWFRDSGGIPLLIRSDANPCRSD